MAIVSSLARGFCNQYKSTTMAVVSLLLMEKIVGSQGALLIVGCTVSHWQMGLDVHRLWIGVQRLRVGF